MANIKREQERDELHKAIWSIADDLRGSVDGWDFKAEDVNNDTPSLDTVTVKDTSYKYELTEGYGLGYVAEDPADVQADIEVEEL